MRVHQIVVYVPNDSKFLASSLFTVRIPQSLIVQRLSAMSQ